MMLDRHLLQRIDACRPGSDDLHDAGLAPLADELAESAPARALYNRVQGMDQAIGEAVQDVPLPAGLNERLLARLAAEQGESAIEQEPPPPAVAAGLPSPATEPVSRRRWLRWSVSVAAAASIAGIAGFYYLHTRGTLIAEKIDDESIAYYDQEEPQPAYALETAPAGYPLSRFVYRLPGTRWRPVTGFLHRNLNGVAYDLMFRGASATLYVVPTSVASLPSQPPLRLGMSTGNRAAAAWQEGSLLYVLVVEGSERTYQSFIRRPVVG
jgi:hypothetical protein